jgi:ribonuclease Z
MLRKLLIGLAAALVILGGVGAVFGDRFLTAAVQRQVVRTLTAAAFKELPAGLNVILCGAGSPMPDPERSGPCVAIAAGQRIIVIDAGASAARGIALSGLPVGQISDAFITHFHSDHIDGLGELMLQRWANGARDAPMPVHGPTGIEQVVEGFNLAYRQDTAYRVAHHGPATIPPTGNGGVARPFATPAMGEGVVVLDADGLKVTAFLVEHPPIVPAVGYRIDYAGRSVLVSGDTKKSANVEKFAAGVDVLVHEALAPQLVQIITAAAQQAGVANIEKISQDILSYHTTPVEVAEIARAAGAKHILYYHTIPPLMNRPLKRMFLRGVSDAYAGDVTIGTNGTWIALPAGSTAIEVGHRP